MRIVKNASPIQIVRVRYRHCCLSLFFPIFWIKKNALFTFFSRVGSEYKRFSLSPSLSLMYFHPPYLRVTCTSFCAVCFFSSKNLIFSSWDSINLKIIVIIPEGYSGVNFPEIHYDKLEIFLMLFIYIIYIDEME